MTIKEHIYISKRSIKHCFELSKKYTIFLIINAFLGSIIRYIPVYFSAKIIDCLNDGFPLRTTITYIVLTVSLTFFLHMLIVFIASLKKVAEQEMFRNEDWQYSEKAMKMTFNCIESSDVTALRYQVRRESQKGHNISSLFKSVEKMIGSITTIIGSSILLVSFFSVDTISIHTKLLLVLGFLIAVTTSIYFTSKINKVEQKLSTDSIKSHIFAEHFFKYIEDFNVGKEVRVYNTKEFLLSHYSTYNKDFEKKEVIVEQEKTRLSIPILFFETLFKLEVYVVLVYNALYGNITVGSIAKYVTCLSQLISGSISLIQVFQTIMDNNIYLKRYFSYFDLPDTKSNETRILPIKGNTIEFKNVSFYYPKSQTRVLEDINLKINSGERVAIVGANGSGKTTLIKLLCQLYPPVDGKILVDGMDIRKSDMSQYSKLFSVVFQDFSLFSFKLGEVISCGKQFDSKRVEKCLSKANFIDWNEKMPNGLETYLYKEYDHSGIEISGGEAQKIAIARSLYKDASLIILDEPTAALDPVSEYEIYSKFDEIAEGKTAIYISHRLASCRFCDKIVVLDQGKIVEVGNHSDLIKNIHGQYYKLWNAQAQYYS